MIIDEYIVSTWKNGLYIRCLLSNDKIFEMRYNYGGYIEDIDSDVDSFYEVNQFDFIFSGSQSINKQLVLFKTNFYLI